MTDPKSVRELAEELDALNPTLHGYSVFVPLLDQWRTELLTVGRRDADLEACGRGQHVANRSAGCACGHMPPIDLRLDDDPFTEPPAEPASEPHPPRCAECGKFHHASAECEPAEQPPSLASQVAEVWSDQQGMETDMPWDAVNGPLSMAWGQLSRVAEVVDALTAEVAKVREAHRLTESRTYKANERLDALEGRGTGLRGPDTTPVTAPSDGGA